MSFIVGIFILQLVVPSAVLSQQLSVGSCKLFNDDISCVNGTLAEILPALPTSVKRLTIQRSQIHTLYTKTFLHLPLAQLEELHLINDDIGEVQVGAFVGLTSLHVLDLSENRLTELNNNALVAIKTLKVLKLNGNRLLKFPDLIKVPQLEVLCMNSNELTDIPCESFIGLQKLQVLQLEKNGIAGFQKCALEGLANIQELSLKGNPIETIEPAALVGLSSLKHLDLSHTKLVAVPSKFLEAAGASLQYLTLRNSYLTSVPTWGTLSKLRYLDISGNMISSIPDEAFATLPRLEELSIEDMATLVEIKGKAFDKLHHLWSLIIRGNTKLQNIPPNCFSSTDLASLQRVYLEYNGIYRFPKDLIIMLESLPALQVLSINDNPIKCDCSAKPLRELMLTVQADRASTWMVDHLACDSPDELRGVSLVDVPLEAVTCDDGTEGEDNQLLRLSGKDSVSGQTIVDSKSQIKAKYEDFNENNEIFTTPRNQQKPLEQVERERNMIGVFAAFFLMTMSLLFVFVIVRRRRRDGTYRQLPAYRRSPIIVMVRKYGTYDHTKHMEIETQL